MVRVMNVLAREFRLDSDRTHILDWHLGAKGLANQYAVLINVLALKRHESLAHRLDETNRAELAKGDMHSPIDIMVLPAYSVVAL